MDLNRNETPLSDELTKEIWDMWQDVPEEIGIGSHFSQLFQELTNQSRTEDRKLIYTARVNGELVGTSMIWISKRDPKLCEFGLPATLPQYRRHGIGRQLFQEPVTDFRQMGGEAIFLGTNQFPAHRVYKRTGYRKLVGSIAMVNVLNGDAPEAYLEEYFKDLGTGVVCVGEASDRTPAVPLVHSPHDWQIMDFNVGAMSRRYSIHWGFSNQVERFIKLIDQDNATFFSARAGLRQKVVGLSSAVMHGKLCSVDVFAHYKHSEMLQPLMEAVLGWADDNGTGECRATISVEDEEKQSLFRDFGFRENGTGEPIMLDGYQTKAMPGGPKIATINLEYR